MCASFHGQLEIVKLLVENGASINKRGKKSETALHLASQRGHGEIVRYLLLNGGDSAVQDKRGQTPLHYAAFSGQSDPLRALLKDKSLLIDVKDSSGQTPLAVAAFARKEPACRLLLQAGAQVSAVSDSHDRAFLEAFIAENNIEVPPASPSGKNSALRSAVSSPDQQFQLRPGTGGARGSSGKPKPLQTSSPGGNGGSAAASPSAASPASRRAGAGAGSTPSSPGPYGQPARQFSGHDSEYAELLVPDSEPASPAVVPGRPSSRLGKNTPNGGTRQVVGDEVMGKTSKVSHCTPTICHMCTHDITTCSLRARCRHGYMCGECA